MAKIFFKKIQIGYIKTSDNKTNKIGFFKSGFDNVFGIRTSKGDKYGCVFGIKKLSRTQKLIVVGLGKTGTTTLAACCTELGFNHQQFSWDLLKAHSDKNYNIIYDALDYYDSFDDFPWPLMFEEVIKRYPSSKFILTVRKNEDIWYDSLKRHFLKSSKNGVNPWALVYVDYDIAEEKEKLVKYYNTHNQKIRNFFKDKPNQFLEICWENGQQWDELCTFLNLKIPNKDFPHANKG